MPARSRPAPVAGDKWAHLLEAEERPEVGIAVPEALPERPSRIVKEVARLLSSAKVDDYGAVKCFDPRLPYVRVPRGSIPRVLRLLEAVVCTFEHRGFSLQPNERLGSCAVVIEGEPVVFGIEETSGKRPRWPSQKDAPLLYDFVPSGVLQFKILYGAGGRRTTWKDRIGAALEEQLSDVLKGLILCAHGAYRDRLEREAGERRFEAEQTRREALRDAFDLEARAVADLEGQATSWVRAKQIRDFIVARQEVAADRDWEAWARSVADRFDPLKPSPASVLDTDPDQMKRLEKWQFDR